MSSNDEVISASDWMKGIILSICASIIGGASKLCIRKSWRMVEGLPELDYSNWINLLGLRSPIPLNPNGVTNNINLLENAKKKMRNSMFSNNINSNLIEVKNDLSDQNGTILDESLLSNHNSQQETYNNNSMEVELPQYQNEPLRKGENALSSPSPTYSDYHTSMDYQPDSNTERELHLLQLNEIKIQRQAVLLRAGGMFGMTTLNPAFSMWAMLYASPSVLAPFSGLTLVWIVIFSEYMVNEPPTITQIHAAALIITGEVIISIMGDHTNDTNNITVEQIEESYKDPNFIIFCILMLLWMIGLTFMMLQGSSPWKRFAWGVSGGSITGFQNFLKDGLTILSITSKQRQEQQNQIPYPTILYVFIFSGLGTALIGLLLLTACMKRYDATYSASMFVGSFVIAASIMSAVHYHTFQNLETIWNYIFYPVGLLILLAGVLLLAFVPSTSTNPIRVATTNEGSQVYATSSNNPIVLNSRSTNASTMVKISDGQMIEKL